MKHSLSKIAIVFVSLTSVQAAMANDMIPPEVASKYAGKEGMVCGEVQRARYAESTEGKPTFLYMGGAFPRHTFSVRIPETARSKFSFELTSLQGKSICASGLIERDGPRGEMLVTSASALKFATIK